MRQIQYLCKINEIATLMSLKPAKEPLETNSKMQSSSWSPPPYLSANLHFIRLKWKTENHQHKRKQKGRRGVTEYNANKNTSEY